MESHPKIGLCLSGGGLRATLFHLGVLRLLKDGGMLDSVHAICGVSGGAILAAHMALREEAYKGTSEQFLSAAQEVVKAARADIRGQVTRRIPFRLLPVTTPSGK